MLHIYLRLLLLISILLLQGVDLLSQEQDYNIYQYRNIGPTRGGRVTAVAGDATNLGTFYMGATGGGMWKTTDYGTSWKNVSDGFFKTPSIGAISVSQVSPELIYVGTGTDGLRSNIITGKGMYKTADGGKTWDHIGLENTGQIGAVEIHPDNNDVVYVGAIGQAFAPNPQRGVFKTVDGGKTWDHVLQIADTVGVADIELAPANPNIVFAAAWRAERKPWTIISGGENGGIYKSTDAGKTWSQLSQGLPEGIIGKIDLAVSPADPNRVYALIEAPVGKGGLYRSDDLGATFTLVSTKKELLDRPFYYCNIAADPNDADVVYSMATRFWKSTDGGATWTKKPTPHGDNHDIWIHPDNSQLMVQGNDGGANVSHNGGKTWSTQLNQNTAELYQVEVDNQYPYWLYAGQQDNYTTISIPSLPPYGVQDKEMGYVINTGGCETGPAVPHPTDPNIVFSNCKGRFGVYNKQTGQEIQNYVGGSNMYGHNPSELKYRFQRVSPIHISPHDPDVIYHCSQYVHRTTDQGQTWTTISPDLTAFEPSTQMISGSPITRDITGEEFYSTIYAIQESKIDKGLIWVGANDGPVQVTKDGGKNWSNVTPKMASGGRVDCVEPSTHNPAKAYVSVLRYQLGDWQPYIYKTLDYGQSWEKITQGIPVDYPVRVVREDPQVEGVLYAGTEYGMFISTDDGKSWTSFQQNLPITPITDIKVHRQDLVLSTMGRGFWILDDIKSIHHRYDQNQVTLFPPRETIKYRYRGGGVYPSPRVLLDYYIPKGYAGDLALYILNESKDTIATFTPSVKDPKGNEERQMSTEFSKQGVSANLQNSEGMHRLIWDMRHRIKSGEKSKKGPSISPGKYTIHLKGKNTDLNEYLSILIDPRVEQAGITIETLKEQEELSLKTWALQEEAKQAANRVEKYLKENPESDENIKGLQSALTTTKGRYRKPMLVDQIKYLYNMISRADQKPSADAYSRYDELKKQVKSILKKVESLGAN